ncbi:MAG: glycosyltransferase family 2 protein [Arcobacteraceae bacterium]
MKISVCMATYNGEKYIKEQLDSILSQVSRNDEIIISDDNSTDNTIEILKSYNDKRIKIYLNNKEKGYTKNFENALEKVSGDVIFLCDQDDIWVNDKIEKTLVYLKDYDFIISDNKVVTKDLNTIYESHFNVCNTKKGFFNNLLLPRYVGACMAFKKEVLEKSLPFPENQKLCAHDYWICLIAELYFKVYKLDEALILYRRHSSNASNGGNTSKNTLIHKLKVRIYVFINILLRFFK